MKLPPMPPTRYRIERSLGQGGLGEVFLAFDQRLQRHVALKRLSNPTEITVHGSIYERAWREAVHLAAVQHPNVVTVYDFGSDEFGPFVIMELVDGETLDAVVTRGAFPLEDFRVFAHQTLEGLAAAHQAGLLHRDLKPGNIMLKYGPTHALQVKILDFGIARFSPELDVPITSAMLAAPPTTVLGTVEFMAPEQFELQPLTQRGELYSLGCIFYICTDGLRSLSRQHDDGDHHQPPRRTTGRPAGSAARPAARTLHVGHAPAQPPAARPARQRAGGPGRVPVKVAEVVPGPCAGWENKRVAFG